MKKASIFELIRTAEQLNDQTIISFMNNFDENASISQILVLNQLREKGPQMQSQLAKRLGYTPGAMTGIANKLIKEGYARREYDETDRRVILLAVTEKGIELLHEAQKQGQETRENLYSVLDEEEIKQLLAIQTKLLVHVMNSNSLQ